MYIDLIVWDDEDDPNGNYQHITGTGEVTADEVDEVLYKHQGGPDDFSESSGLPLIYGFTSNGKRIVVVYSNESDDDLVMIRPVASYLVKEYGDLD